MASDIDDFSTKKQQTEEIELKSQDDNQLLEKPSLGRTSFFTRLKFVLKKLGPGFITGASDDDPSGIATYSQTGAKFGYGQLWLIPFCYPFMVAIQEMCGRIGMVTGKGLSGVLRRHYPKWAVYMATSLLVIANVVNIGADLGAMATSARMLIGLPYAFWIIMITLLILILEIAVQYRVYAKLLMILTFTLFSYFLTALIVKQDWGQILKSSLLPRMTFSKDFVFNMVAFLGTTITPYLFFWQADEEVEEEIIEHKIVSIGVGIPRVARYDVRNMRYDTIFGMLFSQIMTFMIVITTAATLYANGITNISTASEAAQALKPLAGEFAYLLFALGIIGTGLLAVPVLSGSAAYAVSEAMGWKSGLGKTLREVPGFYGVIVVATVLGLLLDFFGIDPIKALYYAAAINGLLSPPLMIFILLIGNNKKIMGKYVNKRLSRIMTVIIIAVMGMSGLFLLYSMATGQ
jgi:NRAMP (natural resistance-associated macrophage protein)-like metal ion transporter